MQQFKPNDLVVYAMQKSSATPGRRAIHVDAAQAGDRYSYVVLKFWRVVSQPGDGTVILETRRGKRHVVPEDDPLLRPATLLERIRLADRFPLTDSAGNSLMRRLRKGATLRFRQS